MPAAELDKFDSILCGTARGSKRLYFIGILCPMEYIGSKSDTTHNFCINSGIPVRDYGYKKEPVLDCTDFLDQKDFPGLPWPRSGNRRKIFFYENFDIIKTLRKFHEPLRSLRTYTSSHIGEKNALYLKSSLKNSSMSRNVLRSVLFRLKFSYSSFLTALSHVAALDDNLIFVGISVSRLRYTEKATRSAGLIMGGGRVKSRTRSHSDCLEHSVERDVHKLCLSN